MKDVMVALGSQAQDFSAFEIGAIHFIESKRLDDNPYEPGFIEYDRFIEGWSAANEGRISESAPSLQIRYQAALRDR